MLAGLEAAELPADAIEVGRIADAWGIKGWFKVLPYSADPEALFSSKRWFLLPTEKGVKTFTGTVQLAVKEVKEHSDTVVASAIDVDDRNAAEALRGARIFISRASFPTAAKDEYYWVDLIGLNVVNRQDEELGIVRELLSTGPQTVLVIEYQLDGKPQERMIPFVSAYVDDVDLAAKRIRVDWLADY
ncbi:ribosome maturation factor RimM [Rhodoferax saidenbachensis]|uniref:Ribosome maturation factor RimM n=1 Tax=Rhodoferax saidenbachensis TaxID=1484693 RepID=A0ABU1ZLQ6_9BURK|nr:ribosome maturation factor RimM [Rhodoferax saidenbachensis]MDR7306477.1 16S rRNA processing protein RimM [Rhodoferax saidenbachensis]